MASRRCIAFLLLAVGFGGGVVAQREFPAPTSASDLAADIYTTCLQRYSLACVKPKALAWFSDVAGQQVIHLTEDLAIRRNGQIPEQQEERAGGDFAILDKIEDFLSTHELQVKVPAALRPGGALGSFVPRALTPEDINVPLNPRSGKSSLMRKVIIPFLLGLKFKTGVLVPLALALIALKTWKAMTLGLLSLVLSGAMVIFKFTKPKIVNYEVIHYPHHVDHHIDHHVDHHHVDHLEHPAPVAGWDHPGYARAMDVTPQDLAYRAYNN